MVVAMENQPPGMQEADKKESGMEREGCGHGGRNERTMRNSEVRESITWWAEFKMDLAFCLDQRFALSRYSSFSRPPGTCNSAASKYIR